MTFWWFLAQFLIWRVSAAQCHSHLLTHRHTQTHTRSLALSRSLSLLLTFSLGRLVLFVAFGRVRWRWWWRSFVLVRWIRNWLFTAVVYFTAVVVVVGPTVDVFPATGFTDFLRHLFLFVPVIIVVVVIAPAWVWRADVWRRREERWDEREFDYFYKVRTSHWLGGIWLLLHTCQWYYFRSHYMTWDWLGLFCFACATIS